MRFSYRGACPPLPHHTEEVTDHTERPSENEEILNAISGGGAFARLQDHRKPLRATDLLLLSIGNEQIQLLLKFAVTCSVLLGVASCI
jgi:hypothetical protein